MMDHRPYRAIQQFPENQTIWHLQQSDGVCIASFWLEDACENARAAAHALNVLPDMRAACESASCLMDNMSEGHPPSCSCTFCETETELDAAIAKAKGQTDE